MSSLIQQLSNYAHYHRDPRNIITHFVGVPMIVVGVATFLSRPAWEVGGFSLAPVMAVSLAAALFYFRLDLRYGLTLSLLLGLATLIGRTLAAQTTLVWLAAASALFVVGWVIQFIGHYFEGRKPAFVDDLVGLLVGPLFVTAEIGFALGLRLEVKKAVEDISGPTRLREMASAR